MRVNTARLGWSTTLICATTVLTVSLAAGQQAETAATVR